MHHQPFLMFKTNPFKEEFQKYQGKTIKTLQIQNFSFFNPTPTTQHSHRNKIHLKKPKAPKNSHSPIFSPFETICLDQKDPKTKTQNFTIKNPKIKHKKTSNQDLRATNTKNFKKASNLKQPTLIAQKITETQKIKQIKKMALTSRQQNSFSPGESRFCSLNISNGQNGDSIQLRQKLYQSIDFDNLFQKISSQVAQCDRSRSPQSSPKMKDKLILLDKMKRYSKTPNSKARTVFDQFNLKYLINKRKNFNLKNESTIKGSHLPYFQSFNSYEMKNLGKMEKCYEVSTSLDKVSARCPELSGQQGESRRKTSSFIVIDDHGIVHEQNAESKDRDKMMKKISGKVINMRQMLKIQKIEPKTSR